MVTISNRRTIPVRRVGSGCSCLRFGLVRPRAQQTVPDRKCKHAHEEADYENRGQPVLRLLFGADPDHDPGDVIGAAGLGAPESIAVGGEDEFALAVSVARYRRIVRLARGKRAYLGVRHRFAVRGRELGRDLVRGEEIERTGGRRGEKTEGCDGT